MAIKSTTAETNIDAAQELRTVAVTDTNDEGLVIPKGSKSVGLTSLLYVMMIMLACCRGDM